MITVFTIIGLKCLLPSVTLKSHTKMFMSCLGNQSNTRFISS